MVVLSWKFSVKILHVLKRLILLMLIYKVYALTSIYIWSENSSLKGEAKMADIEELSWLHFFLRLRPNDERSWLIRDDPCWTSKENGLDLLPLSCINKVRFGLIGHKGLRASDEEPSLETSKFSLYFPGSCIPINPKLHYLHWQTIQDYK
jgi:hypothetical protein